MDDTLSCYTKIPINLPRSLHLFLLSPANHQKVEDKLNHLELKYDVSITTLSDEKIDQFFSLIPLCNLSRAEQEMASRANAILYIEYEIASDSIFDAFWNLQETACAINEALEDSIVIDLEQGVVLNLNRQYFERPNEEIPLVRDYITVAAFKTKDESSFSLVSEGMIRFGIDEIQLPQIPCNLGADGAYLLRTVAQFILAKLKHARSEQKYLRVKKEIEIPVDYCEFGNPDFQELHKTIPAVRLESVKEDGHTTLKILPSGKHNDYCDWLMNIISCINHQRTRIHWKERSGTSTINA